ncbi:hypothetical protein CCACVL1_13872 [Corchorus capsularis]|uniref:Pentatricopeptide repeat-containing protein n=1 Tax=Corchorus capsularis TaxID=210143 RepID=A0A1R3I9C7_COCAP|nr:hypothetical protein CCACVL1_13872 [Corchorus capsularis]
MSHHHPSSTTHAWNRCLALLQNCTKTSQLKPIHALLLTQGFHQNPFIISKLITSLISSLPRNLHYCSLIFNQLQNSNLFIYNTLIKAHSNSPHPESSFHYFNLLLKEENLRPNGQTFNFILVSCAKSCSLLSGKQIQNWVFKNGMFSSDSYVQTGVIRLYVEARLWSDARKVFDEITHVDVVKWNVLMSGLLGCGFVTRALGVFKEMLAFGVEPDEFCLTTALTACAQTGSLWEGKWIHEYVKKRAMIGCFAVHGHARKAIQCLERMQNEKIRPDGVVLLGVLTACTHAGLVEEVWGAVLNSCRIHNNVELAELAVKELLELEDCDGDEEDAALVQLSNIYFSAQKSEDGHRIRRMIGDRGLKKAPGCSMIEVNGRAIEFVSGDISHPLHSQIHATLRLLFPEDPDTL